MAKQTWSDKVTVVGVAWNGSEQQMQDFISKYGISFSTMNDQTGDIFAHFEVPAQPAWVFVSAAGEVNTYLGALEPDLLTKAFNIALGA